MIGPYKINNGGITFILMRGPQRAPLGVSAERYSTGYTAIRRTCMVLWRASAQIRWGVWLVGHLGADPVGVGASAQIRWGVWMWVPYR